MNCYIYILRCPFTLQVKYVGKTNNPRMRLKQHKSDSRTKICKLKSWIISLKKKGALPVLEIIETCNNDNWKDREMWWINKYKSEGVDLKNMTYGGDGATHLSDEFKLHLSKLNKGKKTYFIHPKRKIISSYDLSGKRVEVFQYVNEAYLKYKYNNSVIRGAIIRERTAYGFQWRYGSNEFIEAYKPYVPNPAAAAKARLTPILEINEQGAIIDRFISLNDAYSKTGVNNISAVCRGVRTHTNNRYFKYENISNQQ